MLTRRSVVRGIPLLTAAPLLSPAVKLFALTPTYPPISPSVLSFAQTSVSNFYNSLASGTATRAQGVLAVDSLSLLFSNLAETGYNNVLSSYILANSDTLLNNPVSTTRISNLTASADNLGANLDSSDANSTLDLTYQQRYAAFTQIRNSGIAAAESAIVNQLSTAVQRLPTTTSTVPAVYHGGAHLRRVDCAANSALCAFLAIASPPPLDAVMAVAAAVYAFLAATGFC